MYLLRTFKQLRAGWVTRSGMIHLTFVLTGLDTPVAHYHIELLWRKASTVQLATEYGLNLRFPNRVLDSVEDM